MAARTDRETLRVLEAQAAEDAEIERLIAEVAAMSDAELDAELRAAGVEPGALAEQAAAVREAAGPWVTESGSAEEGANAAKTLERQARKQVVTEKRRRPVAFWLAGAAAAAAAGAAIYVARENAPQPKPPPSVTPPPQSAPPEEEDLVATARELRRKAAAACNMGHGQACLAMLDEAREKDPAGDTAPEVQALREQADEQMRSFEAKPK